jgi:hypothetical protein
MEKRWGYEVEIRGIHGRDTRIVLRTKIEMSFCNESQRIIDTKNNRLAAFDASKNGIVME